MGHRSDVCVRARVCVRAIVNATTLPVWARNCRNGKFCPMASIRPLLFPFSADFLFFFFLFSSFCFSFSKKSGSHSQFPTSFVFKNLILFGVNVRLNVLRLVLIIIVRPCEDNCMWSFFKFSKLENRLIVEKNISLLLMELKIRKGYSSFFLDCITKYSEFFKSVKMSQLMLYTHYTFWLDSKK